MSMRTLVCDLSMRTLYEGLNGLYQCPWSLVLWTEFAESSCRGPGTGSPALSLSQEYPFHSELPVGSTENGESYSLHNPCQR